MIVSNGGHTSESFFRVKEIWRNSSMASVVGSALVSLIFISSYPENYRFVWCMAIFGCSLIAAVPIVFIFSFLLFFLVTLLSGRYKYVAFLSFAYSGLIGVLLVMVVLLIVNKDPISLFLSGDNKAAATSSKFILVGFSYFSILGLFTALNMPKRMTNRTDSIRRE